MSEEGHISKPIPPRRLLVLTSVALIGASLITAAAVLPAEFNRDPLGLGRTTGLSRLWAPPEVAYRAAPGAPVLAREYPVAFRSDTIEFPLRADGDRRRGNDLEYKVRMQKDATLIYTWSVETVPNAMEFYYEFHGHTLTPNEKEMTVASYKKATGTAENGALTAPFDGVHGWYFQNQSVNPVIVRVKISGFYELIPPGDTGNDSGIHANVPAANAFGPTQ